MTTERPSPEAPARARRLTLSDVVEQLLQRGGSEHSSVTIARNSKGETQLEVVVRTGEGGAVQTILEAETIAQEVYDRLRVRYPHAGEQTGGNGGAT
jgi:hypothetical protein